jgi:hypothetical protein
MFLRRDQPTSWTAAPRRGGRLEHLADAPPKVCLQRSSIETERRPPADRNDVVLCAQQLIGQSHSLANTAADRQMKFSNERDPHEGGPRDAPSDATSTGANLRDDVMRDQVVGPLHGCVDRK